MVHTLDLTNEYYYTRIQLNVNPFLQKKHLNFSPSTSSCRPRKVTAADRAAAPCQRVKATGIAGGLIRPYKGLIPASATHALKTQAIVPVLHPHNRSMYSFILIFSHIWSSANWFCMYFWIAVLFRPTVSTKYPLHQKCRFPYLYFKFANLSNIIRALFPFNIPINLDTDIFGGIATNIWMWSGHAFASMISTSYLSHIVLRIFPISTLFISSVDNLSAVLWGDYYVILTPPLRMC